MIRIKLLDSPVKIFDIMIWLLFASEHLVYGVIWLTLYPMRKMITLYTFG